MEKNIFVILVLCAVFSGCRTLTVKENMPERWENTYSGMTLEAFKQVWTDSKWAGETSDGKAVYMARSPLVAPPSFGFDYFLFEGDRFLSRDSFCTRRTVWAAQKITRHKCFQENRTGPE
jgi:uncharacterized protein YceK